MSELKLFNAVILGCKLKNKDGRLFEINIRASWSQAVAETMKWQADRPTGFGPGKLNGDLVGMRLMMEPHSKDLKDCAFDITIGRVNKFKYALDKDTNEPMLELTVTTMSDDSVAVVDEFCKQCWVGAVKASCKIQYSAEEQLSLVKKEQA